jgi:charged multivesicular body protein 2A
MSFLFGGGRPTGTEAMKLYKDQMRSNVRTTDRDIRKVDAQEKTLLTQLKKMSKEDIQRAKDKAKELVRLREHKKRLGNTREGLNSLYLNMSDMENGQKMQEMLAKTTLMLRQINCQVDLAQVQRMLHEFNKQNSMADSKQEMVNDAVDEAFQAENEGKKSEEALTSVLEEAGFDISLLLHKDVGSTPSVEELEQRLSMLKN